MTKRVRRIGEAGGEATVRGSRLDGRGCRVQAARAAIEAPWGPASVLVNAAGGNRPDATLPPGADFCKLPLAAWQGVFDLNLVGGVLLPCQVFGEIDGWQPAAAASSTSRRSPA